MLFQGSGEGGLTPLQIKAIAFRDHRSAELVVITSFSFEGCQLSSDVAFELGERLRLHLPGQGWIHAEVQWTAGSQTGATFVIECNV